jgi:hypothetical protein
LAGVDDLNFCVYSLGLLYPGKPNPSVIDANPAVVAKPSLRKLRLLLLFIVGYLK